MKLTCFLEHTAMMYIKSGWYEYSLVGIPRGCIQLKKLEKMLYLCNVDSKSVESSKRIN